MDNQNRFRIVILGPNGNTAYETSKDLLIGELNLGDNIALDGLDIGFTVCGFSYGSDPTRVELMANEPVDLASILEIFGI